MIVQSLHDHYLQFIQCNRRLTLIDFQLTVIQFIAEIISLDPNTLISKCNLDLENADICPQFCDSLYQDHILGDTLIELLPTGCISSYFRKCFLSDDIKFIVNKLVTIFQEAHKPYSNKVSNENYALIDYNKPNIATENELQYFVAQDTYQYSAENDMIKALNAQILTNLKVVQTWEKQISLIWFLGGKVSNNIPQQYLHSLTALLQHLAMNKVKYTGVSLLLDRSTFFKNHQIIMELLHHYGTFLHITLLDTLSFSDADILRSHQEMILQSLAGNPAVASDFYRYAWLLSKEFLKNIKINVYIDFDDMHFMIKNNHIKKLLLFLASENRKKTLNGVALIHYDHPYVTRIGNNRIYFDLSEPELHDHIKKAHLNLKTHIHMVFPQSRNHKLHMKLEDDADEIVAKGPGKCIEYVQRRKIILTDIESQSAENWEPFINGKLFINVFHIFKSMENKPKILNVLLQYSKMRAQSEIPNKKPLYEMNFNEFLAFKEISWDILKEDTEFMMHKISELKEPMIIKARMHANPEELPNLVADPAENSINFLREIVTHIEMNNSIELLKSFRRELEKPSPSEKKDKQDLHDTVIRIKKRTNFTI